MTIMNKNVLSIMLLSCNSLQAMELYSPAEIKKDPIFAYTIKILSRAQRTRKAFMDEQQHIGFTHKFHELDEWISILSKYLTGDIQASVLLKGARARQQRVSMLKTNAQGILNYAQAMGNVEYAVVHHKQRLIHYITEHTRLSLLISLLLIDSPLTKMGFKIAEVSIGR